MRFSDLASSLTVSFFKPEKYVLLFYCWGVVTANMPAASNILIDTGFRGGEHCASRKGVLIFACDEIEPKPWNAKQVF